METLGYGKICIRYIFVSNEINFFYCMVFIQRDTVEKQLVVQHILYGGAKVDFF